MVRTFTFGLFLLIAVSGCNKALKGRLTSAFPFLVTLQGSYSTVVDSAVTFVPQVTQLNNRTISSYTWNFNDGTSVVATSNASIAHAFSHTGLYNISVTVSLSDGVTSSANASVMVEDPSNDPLNKRLLTQADFAPTATTGYQGLFKYPLTANGWSTAFSNGGIAFRYESDGLKFFSISHAYSGGLIYMVNFPGFYKGSIASAPTATLIKSLGDVYGGHKCIDNDGGGCDAAAMGAGVITNGIYYDPASSKLYWNYGHWYNTNGPNNPSFGYSIISGTGANTSAIGKASYRFTGRNEMFVRGGATPIPNWFANRFTGGKNIGVGFGGYFSIISNGSLGATLTAVSEPDVSTNADKSYLPNVPLLGYPTPHHQERDPNYNSGYYSSGGWETGHWDPPGAWNPINGKGFYTWSDSLLQGCTWIDRAASQGILCIIKVCQGNTYYQTSNLHCNGGSGGSGANEWFIFDPKQLAKVATGELQQWQVQPASYWVDSDLPLSSLDYGGWDGNGANAISISYDPISDQVFILSNSENHQGVEWYPVLRGWKLGGN